MPVEPHHQSGPSALGVKTVWYRAWHWLCARIYFERITLLHPEHLPERGPALYLGLHRNGAVDGFVYRQVAPDCVFLISTQLLRSFFARLFFEGIAVARTKDEGGERRVRARGLQRGIVGRVPRPGAETDNLDMHRDRSHNDDALRQCQELLAGGGKLFVFPEGTSSLGPRHLPFKSGAAQIALTHLAAGRPVSIVPLGIHYERPWAFRSRVEVVAGEPISTELDPALSPLGRLKELKRRLTSGLEAVGANFNSAEEQEQAERLAFLSTCGTARSYFAALKSLEPGLPGKILERWRELEAKLASRRPHLHQGVPLFAPFPLPLALLLLAVLGPMVLAGALANLPPLLAGWLAGRKFPDGPNVIALWRILVGLPVFVIWFAFASLALTLCGRGLLALAYAALTLLALKFWGPAQRLAVAVCNGIRHRDLRQPLFELREALLSELPSK